ncbi:MAG: CBS domain-containing protein [Desulfurococcales archaeon]|nr:CBS domain-containing protein [Desulfurococcales archaeon]
MRGEPLVGDPMDLSEEVEDLLVRDVMSTPPVVISPVSSIKEAAKTMVDKGIGSLLVVDNRGRLIGIVTKTDIVREVVARGMSPSEVKVGDIMTRNPYYVMADATLKEAASLMGSYLIGHLPVLEPETGKPVGVISMRDILKIAPHYIDLVLALKK